MKPALNQIDDQIVRRGWPDSPILALCEFAVVAVLFWADVHHHIFISKTLYLFPLAWISLRVRGLRWRDVGLARFRNWRKTLLIGLAAGVALEAFELFISQPLLIRITGRPPDLSDFASTRGHVGLLLLWILLIWTVGASGEEMVYRGYLMNRVAGLMRGTRTGWIIALLIVSIVFGAAHIDQGITGQGALYLGCGPNLAVAVVAHGVGDTIDFLFIFAGLYPTLR
jgi:CAAX protease family protein